MLVTKQLLNLFNL